MEHMELDEIDRLISKRTWERFQIDMNKMEYLRHNSVLEHRIKMLRLQLNVPKVTISKNIPSHHKIDQNRFQLQMRNTLELQELKREKIAAIEQNYHHHVHEIHANSNEIIGMFENLATIKKKRYYENEIHSVRQEVNHLENCIILSKQQLTEIRNNHEDFVHNFVLQSVVHWKSFTISNEQMQNNNQRLNELRKEIEIKQHDVTTMQNRFTELRKVYDQFKIDMELISSQVPRIIAKLPITYNSLEQDSGLINSPISDSPLCSGLDSKRILIIENIVVKPANTITQSKSAIKLTEGLKHLDDKIQSQRDNVSIRKDPVDVEINEDNSKEIINTAKLKVKDNSNVEMGENLKINKDNSKEITKTEKLKVTMDFSMVEMGEDQSKKTEKLNISMNSIDVEMDEDKPKEIKKTAIKHSNKIDDDKPILSCEKGNLRKKSNISDRKINTGKTVEFNIISSCSPRKLRSHKILPSDANQLSQKKSQSNKLEQPQTSKKISSKHFDVPELDSFLSKESSFTIPGLDTSLGNFQLNQSNVDSFVLNTSDRESYRTSTDSKDDDFFITNEGDGFDFFQGNDDKDQLFSI